MSWPRKNRVQWTDSEKVAVFTAYIKALKQTGHKRDAFNEAYKVLPPARRREDFYVYPIIKSLELFAEDNPHLFHKPTIRHHAAPTLPPPPIIAPQPTHQPAPQPAPQQDVVAEVKELMTKFSHENDDRLQVMLDLMIERFQRFELRVTELLKSTKQRRPKVLLVGGLDAQCALLKSKLTWVDIDNTGDNLKLLSSKGDYDLVIFWATFSSHSVQEMLSDKYDSYEVVKPGAGISTIIDLIKKKLKPQA